MDFITSIKTCFTKYADFNGRASRSEYWWFFLATFIVSYIPFIGFIASIAALLPSIAVAVRRMHDTGHSGWFVLIPFYNLYLCIIAGTPGPNEYGDDPTI